jgi:hypothetical protein
MKDKQGFCYEIFKNLAVWSHNDSISYNPCSFYAGVIDSNIKPIQCWNGESRQKIIKLVEENKKIPGCNGCYNEEANGRKSRRQGSVEHYENFIKSTDIDPAQSPMGLDYSVGNLCNLKCVICGPSNSSAWIPDYQKMFPSADVSGYKFKKHQVLEIDDDDFLKNIRSVHFHGGGEPLMSDAHINLLKRIDRVRGLSDVRVFYNTNGTQQVSNEVLTIWEKCYHIELYFSIDDVGDRFEYQRTGATWKSVQENINWFKQNMPHNHMFNVNCAWSYLNLFYLDELVEWHKENLVANRYGDPCRLIFQKANGVYEINHLNESAMLAIKNKFIEYPQLDQLLSGLNVSNTDHQVFWRSIAKLDQIRGTDFKKLCPDWSKFL